MIADQACSGSRPGSSRVGMAPPCSPATVITRANSSGPSSERQIRTAAIGFPLRTAHEMFTAMGIPARWRAPVAVIVRVTSMFAEVAPRAAPATALSG